MIKKKGSSTILQKLSQCFCLKITNVNRQQAGDENFKVVGSKLDQFKNNIKSWKAKTGVTFNDYLIFSVYNNIESFERRLKMANYFNLEKIS